MMALNWSSESLLSPPTILISGDDACAILVGKHPKHAHKIISKQGVVI